MLSQFILVDNPLSGSIGIGEISLQVFVSITDRYGSHRCQSGTEKVIVMEMSSFCKCNLSSNAAYSNLEAFSKRPRMKDVKLLGNLEFHDQKVVPLAKPKKLRTYLLNPMLFKKDLNESTWKIGFLKRLFKFKFPYFGLMSIVKNI